MPRVALHPAVRLLIWILVLGLVQQLNGVLLAAAFLVIPAFGQSVLRRGAQLVWRSRWLLVSLCAVFAWGTAGVPVSGVPYAPTREGIDEAVRHCGRLTLVLFAVAAFLERMVLPELLQAAHGWLRPLHRFGIDADRSVVRLMLALRYAEALPRARDWRELLDDRTPLAGDEVIEVLVQAWRGTDFAAAVLAIVLASTVSGLLR